MFKKTILPLALLAATLFAPSGHAAIITILDSGSATVGVELTPDLVTILNTDFRANALLGVVDTTTLSVLSLVLATDNGAPSPNLSWAILNTTFTELGILTFDTSTASIVGNTYSVSATFTPAGPLTDPGLLALVGNQVATFNLSQAFPFDNSVFAIYNLDNLTKVDAVPEPATFGMLGAGVLGLVLFRRRRLA